MAGTVAGVTVDPDSGIYIYDQVADIIRERIESGAYPAGRVMPSARTLSQELGVSIGSIKRAIQILRAEGFVETRLGRGIVVKSPGLYHETRMVIAKRLHVTLNERSRNSRISAS